MHDTAEFQNPPSRPNAWNPLLAVVMGPASAVLVFVSMLAALTMLYPMLTGDLNDGGVLGFADVLFGLVGVPLATVIAAIWSLLVCQMRRPVLRTLVAGVVTGFVLGLIPAALVLWPH